MEQLSLAVRVTREEYMNFYAYCRPISSWFAVTGAALLGCAGLQAFMLSGMDSTTLLLVMLGAILVMMKPLIIPFVRKGAAGRRYDASDALKGAVTLVINNETITVRTACQEGVVPLSTMTEKQCTKDMIAMAFGKELTVYIPMRCLTEDEAKVLQDWIDETLSFYKFREMKDI